MDIERLNSNSNPLSEKIISIGKKPFKLWLEFEETSPWDDVEDDFANIHVDTLDGRCYGINVWTYKFLASVVRQNEENGQNLQGLYQTPPDLFVRELTRDCIEKTIADLLHEGELEEMLNPSVFGLRFFEPYEDVCEMEEERIYALMMELKRALLEDSIFHNELVSLIARNTIQNKSVLKLADKRIAVLSLNRSPKEERGAYPMTRTYNNEIEFWAKEMRQDMLKFNQCQTIS